MYLNSVKLTHEKIIAQMQTMFGILNTYSSDFLIILLYGRTMVCVEPEKSRKQHFMLYVYISILRSLAGCKWGKNVLKWFSCVAEESNNGAIKVGFRIAIQELQPGCLVSSKPWLAFGSSKHGLAYGLSSRSAAGVSGSSSL